MFNRFMDLLERVEDAYEALCGLTRRELLDRLDRLEASRDGMENRMRNERERHEQFLERFLVLTVGSEDLHFLREDAKRELKRNERKP
jgi:hypothetical protein